MAAAAVRVGAAAAAVRVGAGVVFAALAGAPRWRARRAGGARRIPDIS